MILVGVERLGEVAILFQVKKHFQEVQSVH